MPSSKINLLDQLSGVAIGSLVTGLTALGHSFWIRQQPLKLDPKSHQAAGGEWASNYNLLLKNRSNKTCHAIWLAVTTNNPNYDFLNFNIQEAGEYPPYNQVFSLIDVSVGADFTHILRCEENDKTYKTIHIAMLLPGDQRIFKIKVSGTIKNQQFFFRIIEWSKKPVQVLTEKGTVAIQFSIPSKLCGQGKKIKMLAQ